jgi:hypothetical protein
MNFIKKFFTDIDFIKGYRDRIVDIGNGIYFKIQDNIHFPQIFNYNHMIMLWQETRFTLPYYVFKDAKGRRWLRWKGKYHYVKEFIEYLIGLFTYVKDNFTFSDCVEIVKIYFRYFYSRVKGNVYNADNQYRKQLNPNNVDVNMGFDYAHSRFQRGVFNLYNVRDIAYEIRYNSAYMDKGTIVVDWAIAPRWGERFYQHSWVELKNGTSFFAIQEYRKRRFLLEDLPDIFYDLKYYIYNLFYEGFVHDPFSTKVVIVFFFLAFISKIICYIFYKILNFNNKIDSISQSIKNFHSTINELDFYRIQEQKFVYKLNKLLETKWIVKFTYFYDEFFYYFYIFDKYILVPIINILTQFFYVLLFSAENYLKFYKFYFSFYYNFYVLLNVPFNLFFYYTIYLPKYYAIKFWLDACDYADEKYKFDLFEAVEYVFYAIVWYYFWKYIKFRVWLTDIANLVAWLKGISESEFLKSYFSCAGLWKMPIFFIIYILIYILII